MHLLIKGDARRLPVDPKAIDAIVSDPPYGIRYSPGGGGRGWTNGVKTFSGNNLIINDDKPFDPSLWLNFPIVVLWGANHFADKLPARATWFVWDKRQDGLTNDFADCEMAWCSVGGPARMFRYLWCGAFKAGEHGWQRHHPTQKPIALMRWCIQKLKLKPNSLILDPYCGSGSTGIAALQEGHRFIGIDLDGNYVRIAKRRIERPHSHIPRPAREEHHPLFDRLESPSEPPH
jgi:site-specific DNA-methyltransferase (adenine-specific)/modification methylase